MKPANTWYTLVIANRLSGSARAVRDAREKAPFGENSPLQGRALPEGGGAGP